MRESIGGSMLLNLVIIFAGLVIVFFIGILSYSKAYRVKNRIIEIIEKYDTYIKLDGPNNLNSVTQEINSDLSIAGYNTSYPSKCDSIRTNLVTGEKAKYDDSKLSQNLNTYGYNYCVFEVCNTKDSTGKCIDNAGKYYVVVTFIQFEIPVIEDVLTFPVYGETKILEKKYNY